MKPSVKKYLVSPSGVDRGHRICIAVTAQNPLEAAIKLFSLAHTGFPENGKSDVYALIVWEYAHLGTIGKALYQASAKRLCGKEIPDGMDSNDLAKVGKLPYRIRVEVFYALSDEGLEITFFAE